MSKNWPLLVLLGLKYYAEKRLLKTFVVFFMKVTVYLQKACRLLRHLSVFEKLCFFLIKKNISGLPDNT
jgi:hypothetical protein